MGHKARSLLLAALTFPFQTAQAQEQSAQEVLEQVSATYQALVNCHFEGKTVSETRTRYATSKQELSFEIAAAEPGKVKVVFDYGNGNEWIRVSDGANFTHYRSITRQLDRKSASSDDTRMLSGTLIGKYSRLTEGIKSAAMSGSESIEVGGSRSDCYVVEVQYESGPMLQGAERLPTRYWIDKKRHLVLRQTSGTRSGEGDRSTENTSMVTFTRADVDAAVPAPVFEFRHK